MLHDLAKRGHAVALAAALLATTGCSSSKDDNSSMAAASGGQQDQDSGPSDNSLDNTAVPVTPPSPVAIAAIPAAFAGRWGLTDGDCDPKRASDAKGSLRIAGNVLSFYESRGTAVHLRQVGPGAIAFDLPLSGEGQHWFEPTRLTLQGDGRVLIRQATGTPDRAGAFTYQRCPA